MKIRSINDIQLAKKQILVRVDFNVTLNKNNSIANDNRIIEALPTIKKLLTKHNKVVLMSHLGRPEGKTNAKYSMRRVAARLEKLLKQKVHFIDDFWRKEAVSSVRKLSPGSLILLENLRFNPGEEQNDPQFAKLLASYGEIFVNDAFGTAHRAHASTVGVTRFIPSYAGLLIDKEIRMIGRAITDPKRPFLVIIGGGKTPEKIRVIDKLLDKADAVFLGGAIANTFFAMWGVSVGISKVDHEMIEMARQVFWKATQVSARLILPKDVVVTNGVRSTKPFVLPYDQVPGNLSIFDIGPESLSVLKELTAKANTIIWNGPMGLYEDKRFTTGTRETLRLVTSSPAQTIIGGGDTISTITDKALYNKIDHVSTGGGAMLEFMEKGTLPAIEAIKS